MVELEQTLKSRDSRSAILLMEKLRPSEAWLLVQGRTAC